MQLMSKLVLVLLFAGWNCCLSAASVNDSLERMIANYERSLNSAFSGTKGKIDGFIRGHRARSFARLSNALKGAKGDDAIFLAYHVLRLKPSDSSARSLFEKANLAVPFNSDGTRNAEATVPEPKDKKLIALTTGLDYPPLAEIRNFLVANASHWIKREKKYSAALLLGLLQLGKGKNEKLVMPVAALYFPYSPEVRKRYPPAARVEKAWLRPFDRYLLDNGLAGVDPATYKPKKGQQAKRNGKQLTMNGTGSWRFPIPLRNVRLEIEGYKKGTLAAKALDRGRRGISLTINGKNVQVSGPNGQLHAQSAPAGFESRGLAVTLDIQGRKALLSIDQNPVKELSLPQQFAFTSYELKGAGLACQECICRYVGDADWAKAAPQIAKASPEEKPKAPAAAAWKKDRDTDLKKTMTFNFSETALKQIVDNLKQISGINIRLDPSANALADLPINLAGQDMSFKDVLTWLKRSADLDHRSDAQGFVLYWGN